MGMVGCSPRNPLVGTGVPSLLGHWCQEGLLMPQAVDMDCVVGTGHTPGTAPSLAPRRPQSREEGVR